MRHLHHDLVRSYQRYSWRLERTQRTSTDTSEVSLLDAQYFLFRGMVVASYDGSLVTKQVG